MKVFVYPEKTREELGAIRWQLSWEELKPTVVKPNNDVDYDRDIAYMVAAYSTESEARNAAKKILDSGKPYFGAISIIKQTVDWFVEEDRVAEWRDAGRTEEIS